MRAEFGTLIRSTNTIKRTMALSTSGQPHSPTNECPTSTEGLCDRRVMADAPNQPSSSPKHKMEMGPTMNAMTTPPSASPSPSQPYKAPPSSTTQPVPLKCKRDGITVTVSATMLAATNKAISPTILNSNAEEADERGTAKCAEMIYHVTAAVKEVSFVGNDLQMSSVISLIMFVTLFHQQHQCMH